MTFFLAVLAVQELEGMTLADLSARIIASGEAMGCVGCLPYDALIRCQPPKG